MCGAGTNLNDFTMRFSTGIQIECSSSTMFLTGEVLDILDNELQDHKNEDADSSSDDCIDKDERQCDFLMKSDRSEYCSFLMMSM